MDSPYAPHSARRILSTRNLAVGVVSMAGAALGAPGMAEAKLPNRHEYWPPTTGSTANNFKCTDAGYSHKGPIRNDISQMSDYGRGTSRCGSPGGGWAKVWIESSGGDQLGNSELASHPSAAVSIERSWLRAPGLYAYVSLPTAENHYHHELQGVSRRSP